MKIDRYNYEAWFLDYSEGNLSTEQVAELLLFLEKNPDLKSELESFENISISEDAPLFPFKNDLKKAQQLSTEDFEEKCIAFHEGILSEEEENELLSYIKGDAEKTHTFQLYKKVKLEGESLSSNERSLLYKEKSLVSTEKSNRDVILVAYHEGWLNEEEKAQVEQLASGDETLKKDLNLYGAITLQPEMHIVYPDKEMLRRSEGKIIAFSWRKAMSYAAAAAVLLFIFTFVFHNNTSTEPVIASQENKKEKTPRTNEDVNKTNSGITSSENSLAKESSPNPAFTKTQKAPFRTLQRNNAIENTSVPVQKEVAVKTENNKDSSLHNTSVNMNEQIAMKKTDTVSVDSSRNNGNDPLIEYASTTNKKFSDQSDYVTPLEYVKRKANEKLFGKEEVSREDVTASIAKGASKVTGRNISYSQSVENEYKEVRFSLGGFSFARKSKK